MISAPTEHERTVTGMAEDIKQQIESGKKNICDFCFHQKVCKVGNQPCTKCSHYQDAADVAPVRRGRWIDRIDTETPMHECSVCGARVVKGLYEYENPNRYCYHCGAIMDGERRNDG